MTKREDYEHLLASLKSSQNEEEVMINISKILRSFSSEYYKDDLYSNSYFKSLTQELRSPITSELHKIKKTIEDEIKRIEDEIFELNSKGVSSINDSDIFKLRELKRDCILLIKELDFRLNDLNSSN